MATAGYEIKEMEKNIEELQKNNEVLKIETARLRSITNLEQQRESMKMTKPEEVSYIEVGQEIATK